MQTTANQVDSGEKSSSSRIAKSIGYPDKTSFLSSLSKITSSEIEDWLRTWGIFSLISWEELASENNKGLDLKGLSSREPKISSCSSACMTATAVNSSARPSGNMIPTIRGTPVSFQPFKHRNISFDEFIFLLNTWAFDPRVAISLAARCGRLDTIARLLNELCAMVEIADCTSTPSLSQQS